MQPEAEIALLQTLVGRMMLESDDLESLSAAFTRTARYAYFVLDNDPESGVEPFVQVTLERLLQGLNRTVLAQLTTYRGRVRGSVNWSATLKARYSGTFDPSCYVCREVFRQYDTPENQFLKFIIMRISAALEAIPLIVRNGLGYLPFGAEARFVETRKCLKPIEDTLFRLRRNIYLRYISDIPHVTEKHLLRASTSANGDYAALAKVYRRYHQIVIQPNWRGMALAAHRLLPVPATMEGGGSDWIRLGAALLHWKES